ncbi:rhamnogalacturonan lyase family protein, partial [Paenibacillus agaridevorans]|uniref:rhamnogalacturonan lyase family protein n=1 Tax=Paenibacillus agaridevorans TaxID=171404 RepID=UPI00403B35FF
MMQMEHLDRGLVAMCSSEGVFLSWRLLTSEATGHGERGLTGTDFHVYRDGALLAAVNDSTNYLDRGGSAASEYEVCAVVDGRETERGETVKPWRDNYYELPLRKPADGVTPRGETYTYSANDMSVGDVDGDGQYEFFVKWDPSNAKDNSHSGYTGPVYIDCYKLDGTLLYRIDLGVNIRAGAHYTQFLVFDFDGDGRAELMMKTAPGTKTVRYEGQDNRTAETYITMPEEDLAAGYSHQDDYRMSSSDYYAHIVALFMRWHRHEEVTDGHWPATLEACFGIEEQYDYPLTREDAEKLADYMMDVYAPGRSSRNALRGIEGFVLDGPEYLTVFRGGTGEELQTVRYKPGRHDDGLMWGDYAWNRIEPGNRVDRFLAGVAYLDGEKPSAIFARGYYTRSTVV